jgi:hypothetical protein
MNLQKLEMINAEDFIKFWHSIVSLVLRRAAKRALFLQAFYSLLPPIGWGKGLNKKRLDDPIGQESFCWRKYMTIPNAEGGKNGPLFRAVGNCSRL